MTLAVVGSRECSSRQFAAIMRALDDANPPPDRIVTGDASGVDEAARVWSAVNIGPAEVYTADWATHGKSAGPRRNALIVAAADQMLAFYCRKPSPGTDDAVRQAKAAGVFVRVIDLAGS